MKIIFDADGVLWNDEIKEGMIKDIIVADEKDKLKVKFSDPNTMKEVLGKKVMKRLMEIKKGRDTNEKSFIKAIKKNIEGISEEKNNKVVDKYTKIFKKEAEKNGVMNIIGELSKHHEIYFASSNFADIIKNVFGADDDHVIGATVNVENGKVKTLNFPLGKTKYKKMKEWKADYFFSDGRGDYSTAKMIEDETQTVGVLPKKLDESIPKPSKFDYFVFTKDPHAFLLWLGKEHFDKLKPTTKKKVKEASKKVFARSKTAELSGIKIPFHKTTAEEMRKKYEY